MRTCACIRMYVRVNGRLREMVDGRERQTQRDRARERLKMLGRVCSYVWVAVSPQLRAQQIDPPAERAEQPLETKRSYVHASGYSDAVLQIVVCCAQQHATQHSCVQRTMKCTCIIFNHATSCSRSWRLHLKVCKVHVHFKVHLCTCTKIQKVDKKCTSEASFESANAQKRTKCKKCKHISCAKVHNT